MLAVVPVLWGVDPSLVSREKTVRSTSGLLLSMIPAPMA